jgi:eukaryotic-like serine/threonine-protein kinase
MSLSCPNCASANADGSRFCSQCATPLPGSLGAGAPAVSGASAFLPRGPFILGKYHVQRVLGRGAMGVVYEALDTYIGRRVALKTIRLEVAVTGERAQSLSRRLAREARAAGRLLHPNIILVYEAGELEGLSYIAMELVEGATLAELLDQRGPLPRRRAIELGLQVSRALGYAHERQIIHRDIKPSNLLLSGDERVKVTDFGLAKVLWESASLTREGGTVGTPAYMSPEQIAGRADDGRSDLFSLAAVVYQCLTGRPPFQALNVHALMYQILEGTPRPVELADPALEPAYRAFFERALAKDPEHRIPDARAFADEMEKLLALEPAASDSPASVEPHRLDPAHAGHLRSGDETLDLGHDSAAEPLPARLRVPRPTPRRTAAVLGFANLSGLPEVAWISVALSEALGALLACPAEEPAGRTPALRILGGGRVERMKLELPLPFPEPVAARPGAPQLKKSVLARIRKSLGADLVMYGSYLALGEKARGQLRLELVLRDAATGRVLGTLSRSGTESDLQDMASRAASEIRGLLGLAEPSAADLEAARSMLPARPDALRPYCEGLLRLWQLDALGACDPLKKAVAAEPAHPLPHAALAEVWLRLGYGVRAKEAGRRAFELGSHLPRQSLLRIEACYRTAAREQDKAEEVLRRLASAYPDEPDYVLELAEAQLVAGRAREALASVEALRRAENGSAEPRLDRLEARAAGALGDVRRQQEAAARAAAGALAREARIEAAEARLTEADAWARLGEPKKAAAAVSEARRTFTQAGERLGVARALAAAADLQLAQQALPEARRTYEEILAVCREAGEKAMLAWSLTHLGRVLQKQGHATAARKKLDEALASFREIDDNRGFTAALCTIAAIAWQQGDLAGSRKMYEEAGVIARESGDLAGRAESLEALGRIQLARDQPAEADRRWREALSLGLQRGDLLAQERCRLALAELELEERGAAPAEPMVREALAALPKEGASEEEAWSEALLGRCLLERGEAAEACRAAERAAALAERIADRYVRLALAITTARLQALAAPETDAARARRELEGHLAVAQKAGFVGLALEARLALGTAEAAAGLRATAVRIEAFYKEAAARGFQRIARRIRELGSGGGSS